MYVTRALFCSYQGYSVHKEYTHVDEMNMYMYMYMYIHEASLTMFHSIHTFIDSTQR